MFMNVGSPRGDAGMLMDINSIKRKTIQNGIVEKSVLYWQGLLVSAVALDTHMATVGQQATRPLIPVRPNKASQYAVFAKFLPASKPTGPTNMAFKGSEQFVL